MPEYIRIPKDKKPPPEGCVGEFALVRLASDWRILDAINIVLQQLGHPVALELHRPSDIMRDENATWFFTTEEPVPSTCHVGTTTVSFKSLTSNSLTLEQVRAQSSDTSNQSPAPCETALDTSPIPPPSHLTSVQGSGGLTHVSSGHLIETSSVDEALSPAQSPLQVSVTEEEEYFDESSEEEDPPSEVREVCHDSALASVEKILMRRKIEAPMKKERKRKMKVVKKIDVHSSTAHLQPSDVVRETPCIIPRSTGRDWQERLQKEDNLPPFDTSLSAIISEMEERLDGALQSVVRRSNGFSTSHPANAIASTEKTAVSPPPTSTRVLSSSSPPPTKKSRVETGLESTPTQETSLPAGCILYSEDKMRTAQATPHQSPLPPSATPNGEPTSLKSSTSFFGLSTSAFTLVMPPFAAPPAAAVVEKKMRIEKPKWTPKKNLGEAEGCFETKWNVRCRICDLWFDKRSRSMIIYHAQNHNKLKQCKCSICGFESHDISKIEDHLKAVHTSTDGSEMIVYKNELYLAGREVIMDRCFPTIASINREDHSADRGEERYECSICDMQINRSLLAHHIVQDHPKVEVYDCEECPFRTVRKRMLVIHMQTHHFKPGTMNVKGVKEEFTRGAEYLIQSFFPDADVVSDDKIEQEYRRMGQARMRQEIKKQNAELDGLLSLVTSPKGHAKCAICKKGRPFLDVYDMIVHVRRHIKEDANLQWKCPECTYYSKHKIFVDKHMLENHKHSQLPAINRIHELAPLYHNIFRQCFPAHVEEWPKELKKE